MTERNDSSDTESTPEVKDDLPAGTRRPYEAPSCEKKRSIHRVTLLSGMGVMSVGVISMTG